MVIWNDKMLPVTEPKRMTGCWSGVPVPCVQITAGECFPGMSLWNPIRELWVMVERIERTDEPDGNGRITLTLDSQNGTEPEEITLPNATAIWQMETEKFIELLTTALREEGSL